MPSTAPVREISVDERFSGLIADLSAIGFRIPPESRLRALSLLLALSQDRQRRARLSSLLSPLLCHSVEEQAAFKPVMLLWFPDDRIPGEPESHEQADKVDTAIAPVQLVSPAAESSAEHRASRQTSRMFFTVVAVIFLAVALSLIFSRGAPPPTQVKAGPTVVDSLRSFYFATGPFLRVLLWMVPIAFIAVLSSSSRKSLVAYARRLEVVPRGGLPPTILGDPERLERSPTFFREIQPLRQPIAVESLEIDVPASIDRTVANGGAPEPIYALRRISPDYRVLIDARGVDDHLASYAEQFVRELERASVNLSTYWYDRNPQRLMSRESGRVFEYDEIVQDRVHSRLIVFGDGDAWIDERSGTAASWTLHGGKPARQMLFTSRHPRDWGQTELMLGRQLGFTVFPASEAGIVMAARAIGDGKFERAASVTLESRFAPPDRLGGFLEAASWRWINAAPPPDDEVDELLSMLQQELSAGAFQWLVALAVFPTISWPLSVFLGRHIVPHDDSRALDAAMLEIAWLPWLRYGTIPTWLRRRLIDAASPQLRETVHRALNEILVPSIGSRSQPHLALEFAVATGTAPATGGSREAWQRDAILLDLMIRQDTETTDFQVPTALARALGLRLLAPVWQDVFGRSERTMMRENAEDIKSFVNAHAPSKIRAVATETKRFGDALEPVEWLEAGDRNVTPSRRLLLYRRDPNQQVRRVIDDVSLDLYQTRKRVAVRAGIIGLVAAVISLCFVNVDSNANFGVIVAGFAFLVYFPAFFYWLLFVRPFTKYVAMFPTVNDSLIRHTWR